MAPVSLSKAETRSPIVTREVIPLFYVESANQHSLQSIQPPLLHGLQHFILQLKKILTSRRFFIFFIFVYFCNLRAPQYFLRNEAANS